MITFVLMVLGRHDVNLGRLGVFQDIIIISLSLGDSTVPRMSEARGQYSPAYVCG